MEEGVGGRRESQFPHVETAKNAQNPSEKLATQANNNQ